MAGICEHVQYEPELLLEKMEVCSSGGTGEKLEWRQVRGEMYAIQDDPTLLFCHTSFLFSVSET